MLKQHRDVDLQKDPVCGMNIKEKYAKKHNYTSKYLARDYYFCSASCKKAFDSDPNKYINLQ